MFPTSERIEAVFDAIEPLREGKNREIRRVMELLGHSVSRLIRTSFGPFQLGKLARGNVEEVPAKVLASHLPADVKPDAAHRRR